MDVSMVLGAIVESNGGPVLLAILILLAVLCVVGGIYLTKLRRRNRFIWGFRTPWTLTSELSWSHTNRLGGRLFVLLGLATLVAIPFGAVSWLIMVVGAVLILVALLPYSYLVWSRDTDRHPPPASDTL